MKKMFKIIYEIWHTMIHLSVGGDCFIFQRKLD